MPDYRPYSPTDRAYRRQVYDMTFDMTPEQQMRQQRQIYRQDANQQIADQQRDITNQLRQAAADRLYNKTQNEIEKQNFKEQQKQHEEYGKSIALNPAHSDNFAKALETAVMNPDGTYNVAWDGRQVNLPAATVKSFYEAKGKASMAERKMNVAEAGLEQRGDIATLNETGRNMRSTAKLNQQQGQFDDTLKFKKEVEAHHEAARKVAEEYKAISTALQQTGSLRDIQKEKDNIVGKIAAMQTELAKSYQNPKTIDGIVAPLREQLKALDDIEKGAKDKHDRIIKKSLQTWDDKEAANVVFNMVEDPTSGKTHLGRWQMKVKDRAKQIHAVSASGGKPITMEEAIEAAERELMTEAQQPQAPAPAAAPAQAQAQPQPPSAQPPPAPTPNPDGTTTVGKYKIRVKQPAEGK